jgi:hypothetical protein
VQFALRQWPAVAGVWCMWCQQRHLLDKDSWRLVRLCQMLVIAGVHSFCRLRLPWGAVLLVFVPSLDLFLLCAWAQL